MKYICQVCGYVYDEEKEGVPFASLPDSWTCPLCGAPKSDFAPQESEIQKAAPKSEDAPPNPEDAPAKPAAPAADTDLTRLSVAQMATVCSNLARGCEKQYKPEESAKFSALAKYFDSIAPAAKESEISDILTLLNEDLNNGYPALNAIASENADRGALRVKAWGEKVTRILKSLLDRYQREGEGFLENTDIWVCSVCGFVYVGANPPEVCPVCKVPAWKFDKIERRAAK